MISVSGAGPVGLFTAYLLSALGERVSVYEVKRKRGGRICGGIISTDFLSMFPPAKDAVINVVNGAEINFYGRYISVDRKKVAVVLDNDLFMKLLEECALSEGATVYYGRKSEPADLNVIAEGAFSDTRRRIFGKPVKKMLAVQVLCRGSFSDRVELFFDDSFPFFAWIIPLDERTARVGAGVGDHSAISCFIKRRGLKAVGIPLYRYIPIDVPLRNVVYGNNVFIGDSVPHTKATTGGGLYYGFSASLALSRGVREYSEWHKKYAYPRLLLHYVIRKMIDRMRDIYIPDDISKVGDMNDPFFVLKRKDIIFRNAFLFLRNLLVSS